MRDRDEFVEGLSEPHELHVLLDRELIEAFTVSPPKKQQRWERDDSQVDAHLKKRFHVSAGPHALGVTFPRKFDSLLEIDGRGNLKLQRSGTSNERPMTAS